MAADETPGHGHAKWVPEGLVTLGVAFVLAQLAIPVLSGGPRAVASWDVQLSVALTLGFSALVVLGGLWLGRSGVAPARYPRVAAWCLGVSLVILLINVVMIFTWPAETAVQNAAWAVQAATMGAAGGVLFGSIEARAIERARAAERARVEADHQESQREWLAYLNSLLRHEVMNTANVITGYADLLLEDLEEGAPARTEIERIARRSRELSDVIQDVRLLIDASKADVDLRPVDVSRVVKSEAAALEDRYVGATVSVDGNGRAVVRADDLLARAFANLLDNAVEHNDTDDPRVEVDVQADADAVTVAVTDDGPGVAPDVQENLFEQRTGDDHGLGLYLVRTLVERYGGTVELTETGPGGSTFTVVLPRAVAEQPAPWVEGPATAGEDRRDLDDAEGPLLGGR